LDDPLAAVAASLVDPHEYPSLHEATVPGDKVVIALNHGVPQPEAVVGAIVQTLVEGAVVPRDVRVLLPHGTHLGEVIKSRMPVAAAAEVRVDIHDPTRSDQLAYLAASTEGLPIMINRRICDADMVIPVGCLRSERAWGVSNGTFGVYPTFADEATARRFQSPGEWRSKKAGESAYRDIAEVTWLLGLQFTVQLIPASGDQLLQVLSGAIEPVSQLGREMAKRAWEFVVDRRADVVVAGLPGGHDQQTWENIARALFAASRIVRDDGAIAICCDLQEHPGPAMRHLLGCEDLDEARLELSSSTQYDARWADLVANTLQSVRVYLLSRLAPEIVEEMGMAPITDPHHVSNLCRRARHCLLLENSQHAIPLLHEHVASAK
jgi:nickel-dependent lactate racemase